MESKKRDESLELSAQELEYIAGGIAESISTEPTGDIYSDVVQQIKDKLPNPWNNDGYYYKKEEKYYKKEEGPYPVEPDHGIGN
jgi:hypothetical protein